MELKGAKLPNTGSKVSRIRRVHYPKQFRTDHDKGSSQKNLLPWPILHYYLFVYKESIF